MSRTMIAPPRRFALESIVVALVLWALVSCAPASRPPAPPDSEFFEGTWSVTGRRHTLATGGERDAAIVEVRGALVLVQGNGLSRGFHGEAIGYDDGRDLLVGRCVFTDEAGDRVYAELAGEPLQARRRARGTITGGTGRYTGISGEFTFEWQYAVAADDETIQARTETFTGRYRLGAGVRP